MFKKVIYLLFLFSVVAKADIKSHEPYYPFLSKGFNIHNYQRCHHLIQSCPVSIFPDARCLKKVLQTNQVCQQFAKLTDALDNPLITVKQIANFSLITENFPADGQNSYYILSKGYLINTNVDPRELDVNLTKKYKKTSFFIVNVDEPPYQKNKDGSQSFLAKLKITKDCLACTNIAFAIIEFKFNQFDDFIDTQLKSFQLISNSEKNKN